MSEAISAETILGSFSHGATASAGIQSIWEDAADAAPGEIQTEMELVRDTWNGTLFDEVDSGNLLTAAAEAFGVAEDSYLAHIAVGEYTETHCDAVSGNPTAAQEEPEEAEEETAAEAAEEPGPTEEEPGTEPESEEAEPQEQDVDVLYAGDWQTFGPFLQDPYTATGGTVVRLPGEAAVEIVIADLLPGEDVLNTVFSYGYEAGEDPYLVAVVEIRTPASGLNPAGEHHEALVIDIAEGEPELLSRSELPELDVMVEELSPVSGGVVVLSGEQFTDEGNMAYQTVGIDVHTGELVWETADQLIHHDGDRAGVRVPDSTGDTHCTQEHRVIEIATGDTLSTVVFPELSG
ncbi:hypothetical protein [Nesterenkonia alkaliphila]|uniref:Uncharacterized protein n=1 Tax=Nesterenkonia alkaliphila TaxID=1463631 RepID=A0A7K1UJD9_9MICC|nr:hypothetical protein [Nesterenkonia alkaliphila]MVT26590.1 hypothetical protein [Nesterenkonia alkaliphila]